MKYFTFKSSISSRTYLKFSYVSFLLISFIWCLLSYGKLIDPFFLPSPTKVISTVYLLFSQHDLLIDIGISIFRIIVAFTISAIIAIPLGIFMSSFKPVEAIFEPPVDFIRYLPVPALVPLTILWFGIGETSKIFLLFVGTFFQLVLLVMDDANNVKKEYFEIAYTLGANTKDVMIRVLLPAVLPNIYDDLRITLGWCWTYLLIGEIVAAKAGLGHLIQEAQRFAKPEVVFSGILIIGLIGLLTDYCFKLFGKVFFKYLQ